MDNQNAFSTRLLTTLLVGNALLLGAVYFSLAAELVIVAVAATLLFTLGEWALLRGAGRRALDEGAREAEAPPARQVEQTPPPPRLEPPAQPSEAPAIQILSILQREGRLLDFLQEDIQPYDDAQIGAAVRAVHEGCRHALAEHVTLTPILDEAEGTPITLPAGFDAHAIRLSGHVAGEPPFRGTVRHRGWRVTRIELPQLMQKQDRVVAAAEVEV